MIEPQTLTRPKLYEAVWSKAMTKVAADFGLSDNGLRKICKRYNVPYPPRGYWAKLEAGKPVKRTRLPQPSKEEDIRIAPSGVVLGPRPDITKIKPTLESIVVVQASSLENAPSLVKSTQAALERADKRIRDQKTRAVRKPWEPNFGGLEVMRLNDRGRRVPDGKALGCLVSPPLRERALLIWESIIRTGEACGLSFKVADRTNVEGYGGSATLGLYEIVTKADRKPEQFFRDDVLTGTLRIVCDGTDCPAIKFTDEKGKPLEEQLHSLITKIVKALAGMKERREARLQREEENRRRWEEQRRAEEARQEQRRIAAEEAARERERRERLATEAGRWAQAQQIRDYVAAVKCSDISRQNSMATDEWLNWAQGVADSLDPLPSRLRSITER
jgi:hypothetical protein